MDKPQSWFHSWRAVIIKCTMQGVWNAMSSHYKSECAPASVFEKIVREIRAVVPEPCQDVESTPASELSAPDLSLENLICRFKKLAIYQEFQRTDGISSLDALPPPTAIDSNELSKNP